jgi:hypothetical protein
MSSIVQLEHHLADGLAQVLGGHGRKRCVEVVS